MFLLNGSTPVLAGCSQNFNRWWSQMLYCQMFSEFFQSWLCISWGWSRKELADRLQPPRHRVRYNRVLRHCRDDLTLPASSICRGASNVQCDETARGWQCLSKRSSCFALMSRDWNRNWFWSIFRLNESKAVPGKWKLLSAYLMSSHIPLHPSYYRHVICKSV